MITIAAIGSFEGVNDHKTYPGKVYVCIRPIPEPPAGFLKTLKCRKEFGRPEDGQQQVGSIAVVCDPAQVPSGIGIGEKIALSCHFWPLSNPKWSNRGNKIYIPDDPQPVYTLASEIKPTTTKAGPFAFSASCYYHNAIRSPDDPQKKIVRGVLDDAPPAGILHVVNVNKGRGYVGVKAALVPVSFVADLDALPKVGANDPMEVNGVFWPVCGQYWHETDQVVKTAVIGEPVFLVQSAKSVKPVEEKAKA